MASVGWATLQIIPSMRGVKASVDRAMRPTGQSAAKVFSQGFAGNKQASRVLESSVVSSLDTAGAAVVRTTTRTVKKVFKAAAIAGAFALGASIKGGISRMLNIEDAQAKLRGLGHDTEVIDQIMVDALASVKGTAFGLDSAATAAAGAIASGVKPGKDLERTLRLIGDAATIGGTSFEEMGGIFNKVSAANRASMEEINQLADRGIPIMQWLAEEYGVTAVEARKMVSDGEVNFRRFRKAIEDNIGGAALESGETTRGAFKNMMAAASRFGETLIGPVFGSVKDVFSGITEWLDSTAEKVRPYAERFGKWLPRAFERLRDAAVPILERIGDIFTDHIVPAVQSVVEWFERNRETINKVKDAIIPTIGIVMGLAVSVHALKEAWRLLRAATPIGLLFSIVGALVYAYQNSEDFRDKVNRAFRTVKRVIEEDLVPAFQAIKRWWDRNAPAIIERVKGIASEFGRLGDAMDKVAQSFEEEGRKSTSEVDLLAAGVKAGLWIARQAINNLIDQIVGAAQIFAWLNERARDSNTGIVAVFSRMSQRVSSTFRGLRDRTVETFGGMRDRTLSTFSEMSSRVSGTFAGMRERVAGTFAGMRDRAAASLNRLLDLIRSLPGRIAGAVGNLGSLLIDAGRNVIQGLIDGINSKISELAAAMSNIASTVRAHLPFSPAKVGPLSGAGSPDRAGAKIAEMIGAGLRGGERHVTAAMSSLVSPAASPVWAGQSTATPTLAPTVRGPARAPQVLDFTITDWERGIGQLRVAWNADIDQQVGGAADALAYGRV